MKLRIIAGALLLALLVLTLLAYTPDTDPAEMRTKYGSDSSEFFTTDNGTRIHYQTHGNPSAQPVLFLHGSNSSIQTWDPLIAELGDACFCISLDMPGHGLTGQDREDDYSAEQLHHHLFGLLDHLDVDQAVWVGNSWGGWLSWRAALSAPDRVEALVLISASGVIDVEDEQLYLGARLLRSRLGKALIPHMFPKFLVKSSLEDTVHDPDFVTDEMVTRYWELARFPGNRRAAAIRAETDRNPDVYAMIDQLSQPTLILWGEADTVSPVSHARDFQARLPNSDLIIYPNVGHLAHEETHRNVADAIRRFLRQAE